MSGFPSAARRLGSELKRRKVFRTGAAYAVGVFGVWQVVDIVGPALGWSESVLTYLVVGAVGLSPVVLTLAWMFELRHEPPPPGLEGSDPDTRQLPQPRPLLLSVPAILVSGLLVWLLWPGAAVAVAGFEAGDRALIAQCDNTTGDPNLQSVLNTALTAAIQQSYHVQLVSHAQVRSYASSYMGLGPGTDVDAGLARDYAVRTGLKVVIGCSVSRVGERYLVGAAITDPREGTEWAAFLEEAGGPADLLTAIDRLGTKIRSALGESLSAIKEAKPLAEVTTPSLDALIAYTASEEAESRGDEEEKRRLLELALTRDSLFARAHSGLAGYHYFRGNIPLAEEHYRAALADPARIAERDRLWIEAGWASDRREHRTAITLYFAYLDRWSGDADGWYNLGSEYFRLTECDSARAAFGKALELDPTLASAQVNLATCFADAGAIDSALVHYDEAFALRPSWRERTNLNHEYGQLLLAAGRTADADSLFSGQLSRSPSQQAQGRRSLALLRMGQGRYREAVPLLEEAVRQHQATGAQRLSEYRDRIYLSRALEALGDEAGAHRERAAVAALMESSYVSPAWSVHGFLLQLDAGDTAQARRILARAETDTLAKAAVERGGILAMRSWMSLTEGRREEALAQARVAVETDGWEMLLLSLCRLSLAANAPGTALDACSRAAAPASGTGWESQEPSILAHFWLGLILEEEGEAEEAQDHFARFLGYWGEGDAHLRFRDADGQWASPVEEARTHLARLGRQQP